MNRKASAPTIILIALMLVFLSLASGGFYLFQKERSKNLELQSDLQDINTKQKAAELKLKDYEKNIVDLQAQLKDAKAEISSLTAELKQEKALRQEAAAKLDKLSDDLAQQKELRQDLEKKLSQAQDDAKGTQAQIKELQSQKTDLEAKLKEAESKPQEGVELGKILVNPESGTPEAQGKQATQAAVAPAASEKGAKSASQEMEGKVLVVNKEYNFAVVNLGSKDGIEVGNLFGIYHNNKYLGDLKVEKVHDSMAAAGFVTAAVKEKIAEGDKAVLKSK